MESLPPLPPRAAADPSPHGSSVSPARRWDDRLPPLLRPLVRAYLLGFASTVAPRLLRLLLQRLSKLGRRDSRHSSKTSDGSLWDILRTGTHWQRFPAFCAALVGGSTLLDELLKPTLARLAEHASEVTRRRLSRWLASFIAAWMSLQLLQSRQSPGFTKTVLVPSDLFPGARHKTIRLAGRTLDLTLFAVVRALDVMVGELWNRHKLGRQPRHKLTGSERAAEYLVDPATFAASSAVIMWSWFFHPSRLPRAYNKWLDTAAQADPRLIEALRRCRSGALRYGRDTGQAPLLTSMCADYGWPLSWGDPARSVPFRCEMVHMGAGPSCERHALSRLGRSYRWAMATYLPLNLVLLARGSGRRPGALYRAVARAVLSAARSSLFLATFISLFYYGVCLARTRVGPRVLGTTMAVLQAIDGGLCIAAGCALCGWSILLEARGRRKDIALFVAPRALATLLPRQYAAHKEWRETLAFSLSAAVVLTCARENRGRVRGMLGTVLERVLTP